jgi:secreted trypsin-like serine protease
MGFHRRVVTAAVAATAALSTAAPAYAISNGVPDGAAHPYVGFLAIKDDSGVRHGACSGFYLGQKLFFTAAHCVTDVPAGTELSVTFAADVSIDPDTFAVTIPAGSVWYDGPAVADPADDFALVELPSVPPISPPTLPSAGLLDRLALGPQSTIVNVGYGLIPTFRRGPASYVLPTSRMQSTSRFMALTPQRLELLTNDAVGAGGTCFGDSGGPQLLPGTDTVVGFSSGGDAICRARSTSVRLDTPVAQAFLADHLDRP